MNKVITTEDNNHILALDLNARSKDDFLIYANAVNRARAIPLAEDNLKPIHRKILYTFYLTKLTSDKEPKKSRATVGEVLKLSPHGDAATYGALVRLAQGWKLRYPLVERQGNCGNLLGRPPAAARYTNAKLSPIGDMRLADIDKDCVDFVPNYDESRTEPTTLPSKFPWLLCGNNNGIGVSLSSSIVSHNFTEVKAAIEYYLDHKDSTTVEDLRKFIKGPDFPTGGRIINGEDLLNIYKTGSGVLKMEPHYEIVREGRKVAIVFHDLPYGVEIDSGVKAPLKQYVIEEEETGGKDFENIEIRKTKNNFFDITITLNPKANVAACLNVLLTKTQLSESVKVNNTVIKDGKIITLNLRDRIKTYVDYRSHIIQRIAQNDYDKTNHKLTVIIGLQKCRSDIDTLIHLIRFADNRYAALTAIQKKFDLTEEQGNAVLDRKLSKLSKLDIADLNNNETTLEEQLAKLKKIIEDENERYKIIKQDLADIKAKLGEDSRLTEIEYRRLPTTSNGSFDPTANSNSSSMCRRATRKLLFAYKDGQVAEGLIPNASLCGVVKAFDNKDVIGYNAAGNVELSDATIGVFSSDDDTKDKLITVSANGLVKVSAINDYNWNRKENRLLKLKKDDKLVFASPCNKDDYLIIRSKGDRLKLPVAEFTTTGKLTVGVNCGFTGLDGANCCAVVSNKDKLLFISGSKGKVVEASDIKENHRGQKGQTAPGDATMVLKLDRDDGLIYAVPARGNTFTIDNAKKCRRNRATLTNKSNIKAFY